MNHGSSFVALLIVASIQQTSLKGIRGGESSVYDNSLPESVAAEDSTLADPRESRGYMEVDSSERDVMETSAGIAAAMDGNLE